MADQVQEETKFDLGPPTPPPPPPRGGEGGAPGGAGGSRFRIIKSGQGKHVRWGTAIGAGVLALSGAHFVWLQIQRFAFIESNNYVRMLVPVLVLLAAVYLIFWLVGRKEKMVDFLIATEGEMKKVNWSTRKEVWGATKVVIVTVLALSLILFLVDLVFIVFFSGIGVLKFDVMRDLLGIGKPLA
jgi:preprotein translocase SecE subunit